MIFFVLVCPLNHHGEAQPTTNAKGGKPQGEILLCYFMNEPHDQTASCCPYRMAQCDTISIHINNLSIQS